MWRKALAQEILNFKLEHFVSFTNSLNWPGLRLDRFYRDVSVKINEITGFLLTELDKRAFRGLSRKGRMGLDL